jgi:DNA-binding MarR family transcriptional regulator
MARRFDDALRPFGLTSGQFSLLMTLNTPEPPTFVRIAALLGMDRTTLTANLKPLERRRLIAFVLNVEDKRIRHPFLTASGHAALLAALPSWLRTQAETEKSIDAAHREGLRRGLCALGAVG